MKDLIWLLYIVYAVMFLICAVLAKLFELPIITILSLIIAGVCILRGILCIPKGPIMTSILKGNDLRREKWRKGTTFHKDGQRGPNVHDEPGFIRCGTCKKCLECYPDHNCLDCDDRRTATEDRRTAPEVTK